MAQARGPAGKKPLGTDGLTCFSLPCGPSAGLSRPGTASPLRRPGEARDSRFRRFYRPSESADRRGRALLPALVTVPIVTGSSLLFAASQERCLWHLPRIGGGLIACFACPQYGKIPKGYCSAAACRDAPAGRLYKNRRRFTAETPPCRSRAHHTPPGRPRAP
jgi:hypothetical protein